MQDFLRASHDEALQAIERFEKMISTDKIEYFDVHQIESIYDFYFEKNLTDQAAKILDIGLSQHPNAASLIVKKAMLIAENGDIDEALEHLYKIEPIESTNTDVLMTLGWIMLQKHQTNKALNYFWKAAKVSFEDKEDTLLEIAYNLNQYELYVEAIKFLEELLKTYPQNENALFEYAYSLDKVLEYQQSIDAYKRLLDINPFSENGWYNIGIIYNKLGNHLDACQAYDFTLAVNPNHEEAYFNKGNSLVQSGHFKEAIESYTEHITISKDTALTYQYIADCWEQLNNYDLAIRFYKLAIKLSPKLPDAWYGMGTSLMESANFQGGIQAIDQAISINALNADYWFAHARGLFELDKAEDAAHSLENGLNLDPDELTGWFELLKLKIILNEDFVIIDYINTISERYPDTSAIHYLAAIAHYHYLKDKQNALQAFKKGLSIDPDGISDIEQDYPSFLQDSDVKELINQENYKNKLNE
ncbi:tetratricopeptide repeat protein [Carboxylicivirga marina]|uniref:tetratricopeptide repeat protein n=1 Tax=Carboxylicivirga marina TaxID=2800988 RepID=UPI0025944642|nr:tetratricopeptide repeat protein [uncultured Carboxylicivirga sp.]